MTATHTQATPPLGLRLPHHTLPTVTWSQWRVIDRAHGFHVSRESTAGQQHEFIRNEVGAVKVFRRREHAEQACNSRNEGAS